MPAAADGLPVQKAYSAYRLLQPRFDFTDRLLGLNHHVLCFDGSMTASKSPFLTKSPSLTFRVCSRPLTCAPTSTFCSASKLAGDHHFFFECAALHIRCHIADRRIFAGEEPETAGDQNNQNAGGHYFSLKLLSLHLFPPVSAPSGEPCHAGKHPAQQQRDRIHTPAGRIVGNRNRQIRF